MSERSQMISKKFLNNTALLAQLKSLDRHSLLREGPHFYLHSL